MKALSSLRSIVRIAVIALSSLLIAMCVHVPSEPVTLDPNISTLTPSSWISQPTEITIIPSPSSTKEVAFYSKILVEVDDEIWVISHPFMTSKQLVGDDDHLYGMPIWSPDGQWVAFSKTAIGCPSPSSSVWISRVDGSEAHQVSISIEGLINEQTGDCTLTDPYPARPVAWLISGELLAVEIQVPYLILLETGESLPVNPEQVFAAEGLDIELASAEQRWRSFSPTNNRALLTTETSIDIGSPPLLFWIGVDDPDDANILHPPSDFSYRFFGHSGSANHSWSPDGKFLLIPDINELGDQSRIWRVNVETDDWKIIKIWPIQSEEDKLRFIDWEVNDNCVAWWSHSYDSRANKYGFKVVFLDVNSWDVSRQLIVEDLESGGIKGWTNTNTREPFLIFSQGNPVRAIYFISPLNQIEDLLLISYDRLDALFGNRWWRVGPFRP